MRIPFTGIGRVGRRWPADGARRGTRLRVRQCEGGAEPVSGAGGRFGPEGEMSMSPHVEHITLLGVKVERLQGQGVGFVWARMEW